MVKVHGATLAQGRTCGLTHHFSHNLVGRNAACKSLIMVTVSRDECVLTGHAGFHTDSNCLLTVTKVAKAANLSLFVNHIRVDFNATADGHIFPQLVQLVFGNRGLRGKILNVQMVDSQDCGLKINESTAALTSFTVLLVEKKRALFDDII